MTNSPDSSPLTTGTNIEEMVENFSFLDDWEDRYGYLIELGKALKPLSEDEMNAGNKVSGCVSQVWVVSQVDSSVTPPVITFRGGSDAHIVRGLVAVALSIFSGKTAEQILATDESETFTNLGLQDHITPQRANGLRAMVQRLKEIARSAAV